MIDGFKIDVTSIELKQRLAARVEHHKERFEFYKKQVQALREGGVRESSTSNDPTSSLENSAKRHKERAELFAFMADHIVVNEIYRLDESDLSRLEILDRYF